MNCRKLFLKVLYLFHTLHQDFLSKFPNGINLKIQIPWFWKPQKKKKRFYVSAVLQSAYDENSKGRHYIAAQYTVYCIRDSFHLTYPMFLANTSQVNNLAMIATAGLCHFQDNYLTKKTHLFLKNTLKFTQVNTANMNILNCGQPRAFEYTDICSKLFMSFD